jgi:prepilin-type N-terminal cleavage/methylation domain-containing protein
MSPRSAPLSFLLKRLLSQRASTSQASTCDQGLTLIECLVAIVIITLTVVAITPPIFIATATRIQSRRAQQANQIAQGEVDRIRTIMERTNFTIDQLPATIGTPPDVNTVAVANSLAASVLSPANCGSVYPPATPVAATSLVPVDLDGDCSAEYAMQVFRTNGCIPADFVGRPNQPPSSFTIGVRVYSYTQGEALPTLSAERATLALTTGRRDAGVGGQVRKPLQVLISKVTQSGVPQSIECANRNSN